MRGPWTSRQHAHDLRTHDCTAYRHGLLFRAARCFHVCFVPTRAHQLARNACQLLNMLTEAHVCTCYGWSHGCRLVGEVVAIKCVDACNSADLVPYLQHEAAVLSGACVVASLPLTCGMALSFLSISRPYPWYT